MEAEKFHNQLVESWSSGKACGIIQADSKGLRIEWLVVKGMTWVWRPVHQAHPCLRAGEDGCLTSSQVGKFTLPPPFCLIQALKGLDNACIGEDHLLYSGSPIQMLISSTNTFTDTPRNDILPAIWASLRPSSWDTKLTITFRLICFSVT